MNPDAIPSFVVIVLFLCLFYGPWQNFCTDCARQMIFEERAAVFDMAARGEVSFNSVQYIGVRLGLNRLIRFAHDLTLPRLVFAVMCRGTEVHNELFDSIERIDNYDVRNKVAKHVKRALRFIIVMMLVKSLLCVVLLPAIAGIVGVARMFERGYELVRKMWMLTVGLIQSEAECAS